MKSTLILATLLFTAVSSAPEVSAKSPEFGYCYRELSCSGGLLGYNTPDQCRSIYGKSWQSQDDNSCRAL